MQLEIGQHLRPQPCLPVVDDHRLQQPRIQHLQHVLVLERVGHEDQIDRRLARLLEAVVQRRQAGVVTRRLAHMDGLSRELVQRRNRRRPRPGDQDLDVDDLLVRRNEIDDLQALLGHRQVADRDVGVSIGEVAEQLVARRGNDVDGERPLAELLRVLLVDPALEIADQFGAQSPLAALVDEIQRTAVRRIDADHPPLEHLVEVADEWLRCDVEMTRCRVAGGALGRWRDGLGWPAAPARRSQRWRTSRAPPEWSSIEASGFLRGWSTGRSSNGCGCRSRHPRLHQRLGELEQ